MIRIKSNEKEVKKQRKLGRATIIIIHSLILLLCLVCISPENTNALWVHSLVIPLEDADWTLVGEENGDWAGYFSSPAGDVNGDGLGDVLVGAPMAGDKICPLPLEEDGSCPGLPKGNGVAYLVLGREGPLEPNPLFLAEADASFLGCENDSMTARQLYTAGDVNGDGYDDILVSGWKCGENNTGKVYLFLGRDNVSEWGHLFPVEQADASFMGENEFDYLSYYTATAGDVNGDGYDDFLITTTHHEYDEVCLPDTPADCNNCCKNLNNSVEIFHVDTNTWTPGSNLNTERMNHRGILLGDEVLIVGGQNTSAYLSNTELYNPGTDSWEVAGSLVNPRANHTITLFPNGKVLVVGGKNQSGVLSTAELFDPIIKQWEETGSLNYARSNHTASLLPDGRVLVTGGHDDAGYLANAEIYDPYLGSWIPAESMFDSRSDHTATILVGGKVLVVGGQNVAGFIAGTEIYDPDTNSWSYVEELTTARSNHTATLLPGGNVLVTGGKGNDGFLSSSEIFDPTIDEWTDNSRMKENRAYHTATLLDDGRVLVTGGQNLSGSDKNYELFNPANLEWSFDLSRTLNNERANHDAIILPDGTIFLIGGRNCTDFGKVYLILGRKNADWGNDYELMNADATFLGEAAGDRLGRSATGVGDVNGDGYDDFLIGSIDSDSAGIDAGENYLFLGRATPDNSYNYDPSRPWWGLDFSVVGADASFTGENPGDESGRRVAWAGDVNGDGFDDMLMQAALNDYTDTDSGISYLVIGRSAADWGLRFSLANADASFVGERKLDQAGRRLSGAGDVNNDGFDDFIIGAPHNQDASEIPGIIAGKAYIIFGRSLVDWGNYFPLAMADIIYEGRPEIGVAGYDIGWLNDFNGDGIDDFFIAAYGGRNNDHIPGDTYIHLGSESPVPAQFLAELLDISQDRPLLRYFGDYWEPNGWDDIKLVDLILDTESAEDMQLKLRYNLVDNELFLASTIGSTWLGPCTPGISGILENDIARLECGGSVVLNDDHHTLRVSWRVKWLSKINAEKEYQVNLRVIDKEENDSEFKSFGTWTLFSEKLYLPTIMN